MSKKENDQLTGYTKKVTLQLNFNAGEMVHFTFYDETWDKIYELLSRFRNATLLPADTGTTLKLTHTNFATDTIYQHSDKNWEDTLDRIKKYIIGFPCQPFLGNTASLFCLLAFVVNTQLVNSNYE